MTDLRHIAIPGSHNIRDMGGWPTARGRTAFRRALRADSLHRLDDEGIAALRDLGLTLVIDLRRAEELELAPNPFARGVPGVTYVHLSLFEDLDPTALPEVETETPLLALYLLALEQRGPAFVEVMRLIARMEDGAALFHCAAGKDRTGMIAAFLLLLAGAEPETVAEDYAATGARLPSLLAALEADARAHGRELNPDLLSADADTMHAMLRALETRHGGAETYLRRHGLSDADLTALRARLRDAALGDPA
ncbi:tyrosine-protein phosphatase [Albimonas sp. CAU 1670]|uniref:tyrosine-protein phosphatase n=1 Tax=Albimonas sp. CAU 1670 TaxID=3032599 RepID=UPI0023DA188C|nr:tyrosine-protein phosphatase [Albimonas sp. CAU 1670]MDF2235093.1 tyrosine-protein phosphatase [Albimonas sp. CAU 1670]